MKKVTWHAAVGSDVYEGPINGDDPLMSREQLSFYVSCENERGDRFVSRLQFSTEDFSRDEAEAKAERLCANVVRHLARGADPSSSPKWAAGRPVYGSAAYTGREDLEDEARDLEVEAGVAEANRFRRETGAWA